MYIGSAAPIALSVAGAPGGTDKKKNRTEKKKLPE